MSNAVSAKLEREPVEDLSNWDKTDSETKSTEAAKSRNEIHPSHLLRSLKLWGKFNSRSWIFHLPNTEESPKRYSQLQYHFCRHRSTHFPGRSTSQRKKVNYRNSTFFVSMVSNTHWALPWWVMIPLLFHPSSLGTSVSSALSFRWHIQSSGSRKSLERLVATLPKMWGSCYKTGSGSSSVNHMS